MFSPKLSLIFGPWLDTEYFINAGQGYHSNDARGTVIKVNPADGTRIAGDGSTINPVTPMAWARGGEFGIRSNIIKKLNTTLALWWLESDQELIFSGDDGTTSVNGKSKRYGIEWTNYYKPFSWLTLDFDLALTSAHFVNIPVGGTNTNIPNSVGRVISGGATFVAPNGLFSTVRVRSFGDVPLDSTGTFYEGNTTIINLGAGYKQKKYKLELDVFNLFDSQASDIAYAYQYVYPQGTSPQTGIVRHPIQPRMFRATITYNF